MKRLFFSLVLFSITLLGGVPKAAFAQQHNVENVGFRAVDSNLVVIHYDLFGNGKNRRYKVDLFLKRHNNPLFSYQPEAVFGDVGKGRYEGKDNMIIWSMAHEVPEHFSPNPFLDDYYFTVQARRKTRAGWLFFTAALGGAAYYFLVVNPDMINLP